MLKITALALCLLSSTAQARTWQLFAAETGSGRIDESLFIDLETKKGSRLQTVTVLLNFDAPVADTPVKSIVTTFQISCNEDKMRIVETSSFTQWNGKGSLVESSENKGWRESESFPDEDGEVFNRACDLPNRPYWINNYYKFY